MFKLNVSKQGKGTIVDVVRGVNMPLINQKIKSHLQLEENIKNGEAERVEVSKYPFISDLLIYFGPLTIDRTYEIFND